jgi:hypothetical protein
MDVTVWGPLQTVQSERRHEERAWLPVSLSLIGTVLMHASVLALLASPTLLGNTSNVRSRSSQIDAEYATTLIALPATEAERPEG